MRSMAAFFRLALCALPLLSAQARAQSDALPSWNDGPAKQAIIAFVQATTDKATSKYVAPEARIATFDQDGTTWVEQPMYTQVVYYLRRRGDILRLSAEHRAAASPPDIFLNLPAAGRPLALEIIDHPADLDPSTNPAPEQRVYDALAAASQPLALAALRQACRIRTSTLCAILSSLSATASCSSPPTCRPISSVTCAI